MSQLTCRSCDHYTQEIARGKETWIRCAVMRKSVPIIALDMCDSAQYRPGVDEAEDEIPDGEGLI